MKKLSVGVSRHRRRRSRRPRSGTKFLALLLFVAAAAVTWQFARQQPVARMSHSSTQNVGAAGEVGEENTTSASYTQFSSSPGRPTYLYSIIPGGVGSVDDLREIAEHDPVVAQHFQGFDYEHAHLVTVSEKQLMYVAYRTGDKVYWTRKKISLHPGETLISDGKIVARTRCGNRVAIAPLGPPAIVDPLEADFDQPLYSNDMVTNEVNPEPATYAAALPVLPPGANTLQPTSHRKRFIPLFFLPFGAFTVGGGSPSSPAPHTPPLAVAPEPGTLLLLSTGLAGVYWKSRKSRRKR